MEILLIVVVIVLFLVGLAGIVLPVIPSLPVIWAGILIYAIFTEFSEVTVFILVITGVLALIGTVLDFIAGTFGAKAYGASWIGVLGAFIGSIVGLIVFNVVGMLLGSFIGAFVGEFAKYKKAHPAMKAGLGTILGFLFGVVTKIFISFLIIGIFIFALF